MSGHFQGKVAIVTGAGRGMGKATAHRLAREGARVAVVDRDENVGEVVAASIRADGHDAVAIQADVSRPSDVATMVARAVAHYGALHLAVNNAGIAGKPGPIADQAAEDWERMIATNLSSVFYCLKHEIPAILAAGGGSIVNVSSIFGLRGQPNYAAYAAAKHGVIGLTRSAALEYAARGLRINTFCPGVFDTPMLAAGGDQSTAIAKLIPNGRIGNPDEAAAVTCFLLSDESSYVNASEFSADAGLMH
jgi:NAD(P)-dependent dehydrogenase (short-subunit alcohol dehydrogenase family)